jgi:hypothetical protein
VATLYSEALEQALLLERAEVLAAAPPGALTAKRVRGKSYLYWQVAAAGGKWQYYLGPDSTALRKQVEALRDRDRELDEDRRALDRLAAMLVRGGFVREPTPVAAVVRLLAGLGLFRRGAVLVGTQAFRAYGNVLGVRFADTLGRTQDIDVAQDVAIAASAAEPPPAEPLDAALARLRLLPVPGLDPREVSVSYKVRGQDLRVDFLTPALDRGSRPVAIPALGVSAQPLPFLEYLLEADLVSALVLSASAMLVRVPDPARFALHKLWTASERPSSQRARAAKDRRQAAALLEVLAIDRPADLESAWQSLARRPQRRAIAREARALDSALWRRISAGA